MGRSNEVTHIPFEALGSRCDSLGTGFQKISPVSGSTVAIPCKEERNLVYALVMEEVR